MAHRNNERQRQAMTKTAHQTNKKYCLVRYTYILYFTYIYAISIHISNS